MARFRTGNSPPAVILRAWVNGDFELLVSDHILREVLNTLAKPYFVEHVDLEVSRETLEALADFATHVRITHSDQEWRRTRKMTAFWKRPVLPMPTIS
jgi:predicted nucleic acid-binding protein